MNYVQFKGQKVPLFNTPLTNTEIQELRDKHDKFLIKDVRSSTVKLVTNSVEIQRFRVDFGFRPMVYTTALVLSLYTFLTFKKKVEKMNPLGSGVPLDEFFKSMKSPNGAKAIEL